jgi:DNA-binding SARP family transcriptional activator
VTGRGRRLAILGRGAAALLVLVAVVIGLPVVLYRFGGNPIPQRLPAWHQIGRSLLHQDNGTIFLAAVRDISWIAWAAFTLAVLTEAQAALRGRKAPRLRLGGLQNMAGWLVAVTALAFSGQSAATLLAVPAAAAATVVGSQAPARPAAPPGHSVAMPLARAPAGPAANAPRGAAMVPGPAAAHATASPDPQVMNMAFYQLVTVRPGDCLWTIAQRYLGAGDRYPEIARLNLGHDVGHGAVFTDPAVIWPGWVLQLPNGVAAGSSTAVPHAPASHPAHRAGDLHFGRSHHGAGSARHQAPGPAASPGVSPGPAAPSSAPAGGGPGSATSPGAAGSSGAPASGQGSGSGAAQLPTARHSVTATARPAEAAEIPPLAVFAAGMLAGGAGVLLAGMRHRQRQARRPGRRIPLPASAPVMVAEQRLRTATTIQPATALRAALSDLGVGLLESGRQLPDLTGIRLLPSAMEVLLASPAIDPPPAPFTVPGGRQGMAWQLALPEQAPAFPFRAAEAGDLMPGLFTIGLDEDDGYLLLDPEYLRVTTVEGHDELVDRVLTTAAAELATSQLAGWYDLILVGFSELEAVGGRTTCCDSMEEALDLLASKAVVLRRRLGDFDHVDVRHRRLTQPGDEDWALTLLVSRVAPTTGQLALMLDLASDPGGIAAVVAGGDEVPGGHPPQSTVVLEDDPMEPGGIVAHISPLGLQAWPQPLSEADYQALGSMFTVAADLNDVPADMPPYDGSAWPPEPSSDVLAELPSWLDTDDLEAGELDEAGGPDAFGLEEAGGPDGLELEETGGPDAFGLEEAGGPDGLELEEAGGPDGFGLDEASGPEGFGPGQADQSGPPRSAAAPLSATQLHPAAPPQPAVPAQPLSAADPQSAPALQLIPQAQRQSPLRLVPPPELAPEADPAPGTGPVPQFEPAAELQPEPELGADPEHEAELAATLRVGVLGTFTINGSPAALLPAQSQLVLALALNGADGLSNQQLCYLLGADPDHPKPTDSLRQLIVRTRRQLGRAPDGREWIEHLGAGQYALHRDTRFDWAEFEDRSEQGLRNRDARSLREALSLIRGQPFTGCYHWWLDLAFTETVRAQIVDAAEMLAALELADGDPAASARAARTGLAGDATAEQLWRSLMRAEYAAGNLSGVREAWSRCLDAIADIAPDGEPHPETAALYHQLVSGKPSAPAWTPH